MYISEKTRKIKKKIRVINFISSKTKREKRYLGNHLILLLQKNRVIIDTLLFGKKDDFFLHFLSKRTKGIYCRPSKNLLELGLTEELLSIFSSLFLTSPFFREFYKLPFSTKMLNKKNSKSVFEKKGFWCPNCFSSFKFLFSNCFVCGFIFSFN
jgi:hypothetical protein